jgi:uncharacterized repeat protein (TIGR01451 family)
MALLTVAVSGRAGAQAGSQLIPAGSLVIAMDNDKQNIGALFNLKAYGLAVRLLHNEVPLKWVIRSGKPKDGIDFTATASRIAPTTLAAATLSFRGGPIIVHRAYAAKAKTIISSFGGSVAVYELTQDVLTDVHHELQFKPRPWVNTANAKLATNTLIEAGITDYIVADQATLTTGNCATIVVEPHNTNTSAASVVRSFVESGGNFYAQCASVVAFENHASGRYFSSAGITLNNTSNTQSFPNPGEPFSQIVGDINNAPGGSEQDWRLSTNSILSGFAHIHAQAVGVTPLTFSQASSGVGLAEGGRIFYAGGHDHAGNTMGDFNLRRMFLNALLTPARRPASCGFAVAVPDLSVAKTASGTLQEESSASYVITASNVGTGPTAEPVTVIDTLPAGVSYESASGMGWTVTGAGQVVTATYPGTLNAGASVQFSIHVTFASGTVGPVTNRAHISGGGETNLTNNTAVHVGTVAGRPRISLLKSANTTSIRPGNLLTYSLQFTNFGSAPATDVVVIDLLPVQVLFAVSSVTTDLPQGVTAVVEYSRDNGATWTYAPVAGACGAPAGFDGCMTHVRWRLLNPLPNSSGQNTGTAEFVTRVR